MDIALLGAWPIRSLWPTPYQPSTASGLGSGALLEQAVYKGSGTQ